MTGNERGTGFSDIFSLQSNDAKQAGKRDVI